MVARVARYMMQVRPEASGAEQEETTSQQHDDVWFGLYAERAEVRDGRVHLNAEPGWGIEIDWKFGERNRA